MTHEIHPLITNDATLFGILAAMLGGIFLPQKVSVLLEEVLQIHPRTTSVLFPALTAYHL